MQQRVGVGALVALVGGGILWRVIASDAAPPALAAAGGSSESPPAGSTRGGVPAPAAGPNERAPEVASRPTAAREQPAGQRRAFDRVRADGIRQRAARRSAALRAESPAGTAPANRVSAPTPPPMTPEEEEERRRLYIRDAVREQYLPIARSCYDELLARKPAASGKVVMSFAVVGDGADGVVDRVELGEDTTMDDPEFALCVRESMYSTIFEPPPTGTEETTVVYPIVFAPDAGTPTQDPGQVEQTSR